MRVFFNKFPELPDGYPIAVGTKSDRSLQLPPIERGEFASAVHHFTLSSSMISSALEDGVETLVLNRSLAPSLICRTVSSSLSEEEEQLIGEIGVNLLKGWEAQGIQLFEMGNSIDKGVRYEDGLDRQLSLSSEHTRPSPDVRRVFTVTTPKEVHS